MTSSYGCRIVVECSVVTDIALVFDMSGSNEDRYNAMLQLAQLLIAGLPVDTGATRVAVVIYSTSASVSFHLDQYSSTLQVGWTDSIIV